MSFIQIIEYETDRPDEIAALMDERAGQGMAGGEQPPFTRMVLTRDRENPRRYLGIAEFSSYEEAMANSGKPETHEFAQKLAALMTSDDRRGLHDDALSRWSFNASSGLSQSRASAARNCCATCIGAERSR
jgi:hypothetical protein